MSPEEFDQEIRLEHYRSGVAVVREVGVFALKTLIALNSGAFAVLLTFIGNAAAQSKFLVPIWNIKAGMFLFLAGIAISFLVIAYTYVVSQETSPYASAKRRTDGWFVPVAVGLSGIAFICFVVGVAIVITGVSIVS